MGVFLSLKVKEHTELRCLFLKFLLLCSTLFASFWCLGLRKRMYEFMGLFFVEYERALTPSSKLLK